MRIKKNTNGAVPVTDNDHKAMARQHMPSAYDPESELVRDVLRQDEDPHSAVTLAVHDAFSPVHSRLMASIEADVEERAAKEQRQREKAWNWRDWLGTLSGAIRVNAVRYATAACIVTTVGMGGHHLGRQQGASALPVQEFVDDFDSGLKSSSPLEFVSTDAGDAGPAAKWLSQRVGRKVSLPEPLRSGTKIVGVRRHELWGHAVAQAHYLKSGVRVALYEVHEPQAGLKDLEETVVNGRTYLTSKHGNYHVVVWRKGEDIVTMVSPLQSERALRLADAMRIAQPDV